MPALQAAVIGLQGGVASADWQVPQEFDRITTIMGPVLTVPEPPRRRTQPTARVSSLSSLETSPERVPLPDRMKVEKTDDSHVGPRCGLRQLLQKRYVAV